MKLMDAIFGKTQARFGLAMHFFSSKHYAKNIKKVRAKINHVLKKQSEAKKLFEQGVKEHSISHVTEGMINFYKECKEELEILSHTFEAMYTLEYRLEKGINDIINGLDKLKHKEKIFQDAELKKAFEDLREVFRQINMEFKKTANTQRIKMQDLLRDRNKLRDRSLFPDAILLWQLKLEGKSEKREVVRVQRIFKVIEEFIDKLEKGKIDPKSIHKRVQTINKNIKTLKKEINTELELFGEINKNLTILMERLKGDEREIMKTFDELKDFPSYAKKVIIPEITKLKEAHEEDARKEYNRARLIKSQA